MTLTYYIKKQQKKHTILKPLFDGSSLVSNHVLSQTNKDS